MSDILDRLEELDRTAGTHGTVAGPAVLAALAFVDVWAAAHGHWHPLVVTLEIAAFVAALGAGVRTVWWWKVARPVGVSWFNR